MKVRFLKEHLGKKVGATADVEDGVANYLIGYGVVETVKEKREVEPGEKKTVKPQAKNKK